MRFARWCWLLVLVPLSAPAPGTALVAGHAHALADAIPPVASAPVEPSAPLDDGIRNVSSWLVPPPAPPEPRAREWSDGKWSPPAEWARVGEGTALEETSGAPPSPPSPQRPSPDPVADDPELPEPPAPPPVAADPPEAAPGEGSPGAPGNEEGSDGSCLLCVVLEIPRRIRLV